MKNIEFQAEGFAPSLLSKENTLSSYVLKKQGEFNLPALIFYGPIAIPDVQLLNMAW